jgi:hypothetical protein
MIARALVLVCTMAAGAAGVAAAQGPANPHRSLGGRACADCHTTATWSEVRFDHQRTRWPLEGQHRAAPCRSCHDLRDFTRAAPRVCASCHEDVHRGDAGPRCDDCHDATSWLAIDASRAHTRTRLPDLGVHSALLCQDCHRRTGQQPFHQPVTPCVTCHQGTYAATTNPSHVTIGFSTRCEECHQMATWDFALYSAHDAIFPIYSGTHAQRWSSCASCHPNPADYHVYTCTTCHTQGETTPEHAGVPGYVWESTACLQCHPTGGGGSDIQAHDARFPIFSGTHAAQWTTCTQCHQDPANQHDVSCYGGSCHPQPPTDQFHDGMTGYQYQSAQCLACHPDGSRGRYTQHDAGFPIYSGRHAGRWASCETCHTTPGNRAAYTCFSSGCHPQNETNGHHSGMAGYSYVATECVRCHPKGEAD